MLGRTVLPLLLVLPCAATLAQDNADQQATQTLNDMMSSAMQATKPLAEHDRLRELAGEWNYVVEMTMPGMPVMHGSGTTSIREILGGRFIEMRSGSNSQPAVASVMILGYDSRKGKEEYFALGVDTLGHYYVDPKGKWNEPTASLVLHGVEYDQASGKDMPYRQVYRFPGKDTMTLDVYFEMPGSTEDIRMVGVVYQRQEGRQVTAPPTHPASKSQQTAGSDSSSGSSAPDGTKLPAYSGADIEAMDRAELRSAIVEIMRARTMRGIETASRANLDDQYDAALDKLDSMRTRYEGIGTSSGQTSGTGNDSAVTELPSFARGTIGTMSMSEARAALTEIAAARRIPGLDSEQRSELSAVFHELVDRIRSLSTPTKAKAVEEAAEKEAGEADPGGTTDPTPSEEPSKDPE